MEYLHYYPFFLFFLQNVFGKEKKRKKVDRINPNGLIHVKKDCTKRQTTELYVGLNGYNFAI